jgi:hypothetical protein
VKIQGGTARGRVEISYFSEADLERILEVAGVYSGSSTIESDDLEGLSGGASKEGI